jgi:alpha-glucosidase (family GH31 glycosyl hydrolase)
LDSLHYNAVKKAVALRTRLTPYIMQLVKETASTGEPIARAMEYVFPHEGMDSCKDQFMLGDKIMVAPMVEKGLQRMVTFPKGKWQDEDGKVIKGPIEKQFQTPLDRLLWFEYMGK